MRKLSNGNMEKAKEKINNRISVNLQRCQLRTDARLLREVCDCRCQVSDMVDAGYAEATEK